LVALAATPLLGQPPPIPARLPFVDDGENQPTFLEFRAELLSAADRRDYRTVKGVLSSRVQVTDGYGIPALEREWRIKQSTTAFLRELATILRLGGRFDDRNTVFIAPYVWTEFPIPEEAPAYAVVIHASTPLFDAPRRTARVIARLSDEVGEDEIAPAGWLKLHLIDGRTGFVEKRFVRKPNEYRAVFRLIGGRWLITEFQAGVD
jgi:hypothetical protein